MTRQCFMAVTCSAILSITDSAPVAPWAGIVPHPFRRGLARGSRAFVQPESDKPLRRLGHVEFIDVADDGGQASNVGGRRRDQVSPHGANDRVGVAQNHVALGVADGVSCPACKRFNNRGVFRFRVSRRGSPFSAIETEKRFEILHAVSSRRVKKHAKTRPKRRRKKLFKKPRFCRCPGANPSLGWVAE